MSKTFDSVHKMIKTLTMPSCHWYLMYEKRPFYKLKIPFPVKKLPLTAYTLAETRIFKVRTKDKFTKISAR